MLWQYPLFTLLTKTLFQVETFLWEYFSTNNSLRTLLCTRSIILNQVYNSTYIQVYKYSFFVVGVSTVDHMLGEMSRITFPVLVPIL